jgi:hypothetical protein
MVFFQISRWRWMCRRLLYWLDGVLPTQCPQCGRWPQKRSMRWAEHHVAGAVFICADCYRDLYGEYSR